MRLARCARCVITARPPAHHPLTQAVATPGSCSLSVSERRALNNARAQLYTPSIIMTALTRWSAYRVSLIPTGARNYLSDTNSHGKRWRESRQRTPRVRLTDCECGRSPASAAWRGAHPHQNRQTCHKAQKELMAHFIMHNNATRPTKGRRNLGF